MTAPAALSSDRDGQQPSAFARLLLRFCRASPGALGAAIVDEVGECVDFAQPVSAALIPAYDIKLACAHWELLLRTASEAHQGGPVRGLQVRSERYGYLIHALQHSYALLLITTPGALYAVSERAKQIIERDIGQEAGWTTIPQQRPFWREVCVRRNPRGLPESLAYGGGPIARRSWSPVEVIEPAIANAYRARAYIVRVKGQQAELVREPSGHWYLGFA